MKRFSAYPLAVLLPLLFAAGAVAAERTVVLSVPEMVCGSKEMQADMALTGLKGVKAVKLDTTAAKATVTFDEELVGVEDMGRALGEFDMKVSGAAFAED